MLSNFSSFDYLQYSEMNIKNVAQPEMVLQDKTVQLTF